MIKFQEDYSDGSYKSQLLLPVSTQEEMNRGKPNWEHLNEDLHVLITVEDAQNRATIRLRKAADEVRKLLVPLVSSSRITMNNFSLD